MVAGNEGLLGIQEESNHEDETLGRYSREGPTWYSVI